MTSNRPCGSNLQLDQLLQDLAHDLRDELPGRAAINYWHQC